MDARVKKLMYQDLNSFRHNYCYLFIYAGRMAIFNNTILYRLLYKTR